MTAFCLDTKFYSFLQMNVNYTTFYNQMFGYHWLKMSVKLVTLVARRIGQNKINKYYLEIKCRKSWYPLYSINFLYYNKVNQYFSAE